MKSCVFVSKSFIKMFLTLTHCFQLKYESFIHNIVFSIEKVVSSESGEKYAQIYEALFTSENCPK